MTKPQLLIAPERLHSLDRTTPGSRKRMTPAELIAAMGDKHVHHPAFKPKPRSLLPMPNLAGVQPCIQHTDCGVLGQIKAVFYWALR